MTDQQTKLSPIVYVLAAGVIAGWYLFLIFGALGLLALLLKSPTAATWGWCAAGSLAVFALFTLLTFVHSAASIGFDRASGKQSKRWERIAKGGDS